MLDDLEAIQVIQANNEKERRHYTGTVVLFPNGTQQGFGESYKKYDIVDGQQRLTTLVILLKATVDQLSDIKGIEAVEAQKIANNIQERYLTVDGPQGSIFKISLDEDNDLFFKQAILAKKNDVEQTIRSHQNLIKAQVQFKSYFDSQKAKLSQADYFNKLKEFAHKITQLLVFTVYSIEDNSEVGVIFEVMNDRGKKLSELEKVKNLLMYMTNRVSNDIASSNQLIKKINFSWKEILQNMNKAGRFDSEDENQFLRVNAIISFYSELTTYLDDDNKKVSVNSQLADIHGLMKKRFKQNAIVAKLDKSEGGFRCLLTGIKGKFGDDLNYDLCTLVYGPSEIVSHLELHGIMPADQIIEGWSEANEKAYQSSLTSFETKDKPVDSIKPYKEIEKVKVYREIEKYVDALRSSSYRFRDLLQPYENFAFQHVQNPKIKEELRLVAAQFTRMDIEATLLPLNVAVYERFFDDPETQLSLMRTLEIFAFRVYGIGRFRPYTAQTSIYSLASETLQKNNTPQELELALRNLSKLYVIDNLGGYLTDTKIDFYDWGSLKYFLYEYERYECAKASKNPYFEWKDLEKKEKEDTIEHILPQTIRKEDGTPLEKFWCDRYSPEAHASNLKRLGNLTLTEKNSVLGNKGLDKKKEIYKDSRWEIERELVNLTDWTTTQIEEREKQLIYFANERWKI